MIILDFSKAFDKVPHQRLLGKLWNQGVQGTTHTDGSMLFCPIDCKESSLTEKRLPGPLLYLVCRRARCLAFLSFINDLPLSVPGGGVRLFADDCVLYRPISSPADCDALQAHLSNLEAWEHKWCMTFNLAKCNSMTVTRKNNKIDHIYKL